MDAIRTSNLSRAFGATRAVCDLTLSVGPGELFGLVGADGSGKTTALRMLAGLLEPTGGDAWVMGRHCGRETDAIRELIGYMSQRFGLYADLTVGENLGFHADLYGVPRGERRRREERLLAFARLTEFRSRLAGRLSGGMKQKLGLACALIHTPRVLLLDEPTNGVDPVSRREFWAILHQLLREGVTVVVSTAYLDEAEQCHRLGLLHDGRLLACGKPSEIRELMRDSVVEIAVPDARRAAAILRACFPHRSVGLFGSRVHIAAPRPDAALAEARRALEEAGVAVGRVEVLPPSLEDVFIHVLGSGHAPGGGTGAAAPAAAPRRAGARPDGPAVSVRGLGRRFGSFDAVRDLDLDVAAGQVFGFLGPNGAGKSTTIRMLCGLLQPSSGGGTVAGFDLRTQTQSVKQNIGYMSQRFSLYDELTVEQNLDFFSGLYGVPRSVRSQRKQWVVAMAGLEAMRRAPACTLAVGWKQRLALGCAVLHEPPVLFLDEPTSGVDPARRRDFWELIHDMAGRGVTVFVTTHYMDEAEYCDRLALIHRGSLVAAGTPGELRSSLAGVAMMEVQCERPHEALQVVRGVSGVREAVLFGSGLHVATARPEVCERALRDALAASGAPAPVVRRIAPSLEDVFIAMTTSLGGRSGEDAA